MWGLHQARKGGRSLLWKPFCLCVHSSPEDADRRRKPKLPAWPQQAKTQKLDVLMRPRPRTRAKSESGGRRKEWGSTGDKESQTRGWPIHQLDYVFTADGNPLRNPQPGERGETALCIWLLHPPRKSSNPQRQLDAHLLQNYDLKLKALISYLLTSFKNTVIMRLAILFFFFFPTLTQSAKSKAEEEASELTKKKCYFRRSWGESTNQTSTPMSEPLPPPGSIPRPLKVK